MSKINVLITGIGGGGVGEQILKCLRMSSLEFNIIGCDMNKTSKGLKMSDIPYVVPVANDQRYIDVMLKLCKKHDIKALFPGSEPELKVFSENRDLFQSRDIFLPLNSKKVLDICMDKNKTMDFLKHNGFSVQKYWMIQSVQDLDKVDIFPVVLKPSKASGGSVNTFIAQNKEELQLFGRYLSNIYSEYIAQEYVGKIDDEYTVGVLYGENGEYINSIAVKKNITTGLSNRTKIKNYSGREDLGEYLAISNGISQGEIGRFTEVTEPCKYIADKLGATAAINIQCRIHNQKVYVFEINPRISGTSSLRAMVGYNEPEIMIRRNILGETIKSGFEYKTGYITRGLDETFFDAEELSEIVGF